MIVFHLLLGAPMDMIVRHCNLSDRPRALGVPVSSTHKVRRGTKWRTQDAAKVGRRGASQRDTAELGKRLGGGNGGPLEPRCPICMFQC